MELAFYLSMSWLVITYLVAATHKKEVIRSILVYFIFSMLTVSTFTIVSLNLQLIHVTQDKTKFLSLLINRNVIVPILVIIFTNIFYRMTGYKKIMPVVLLLTIVMLLEFINLKFQIYSYTGWSLALTFITDIFFISVAFIAGKCVNIIQLRSEYK